MNKDKTFFDLYIKGHELFFANLGDKIYSIDADLITEAYYEMLASILKKHNTKESKDYYNALWSANRLGFKSSEKVKKIKELKQYKEEFEEFIVYLKSLQK